MENIGGAHELARALGVSRQRVHQLGATEGTPGSVHLVGNGSTRLYDMPAWKRWAKAHGKAWNDDWASPAPTGD